MTAIVQSATGPINNGSASATLGSTPTVGNLLLFVVSYWIAMPIPTITGASLVSFGGAPGGGAGLAIYTRVVVSGDGTAWQCVTTDYQSMVVIELSDVNFGTPISNTLSFAGTTTVGAAQTAPSVTPVAADVGGMVISVLALDQAWTNVVPAGWTRIALATGGALFHSTDTANLTAGTIPDTTTISGAAWTWTGGTSQAVATSIVIRPAVPPVIRVAVTTGAPASTAAFAPTLPTHATGDRLILAVVGKDETTTIPTINQSWVLLGSGTGGTGANAADTGQTFWAVYGKNATSSSETAPTVTPGGTAPNSWEWIAATYRHASGYAWRDAIATSAAWVQSASDTTTASPLTGTAGAFTGVQPTAGDAIFAAGVIPTDLGTALGATTLTATGLTAGTVTAATTQYVENALGNDTAAVWADWTGFTGTASAGVAASFTVTGATLQAGSIVAVALRQSALPAQPVIPRRPAQGLIMRGRR